MKQRKNSALTLLRNIQNKQNTKLSEIVEASVKEYLEKQKDGIGTDQAWHCFIVQFLGKFNRLRLISNVLRRISCLKQSR